MDLGILYDMYWNVSQMLNKGLKLELMKET